MRLAHSKKHQNNSVKSGEETVKRKNGIYLLPNLFTTSALFSGFYGIVAAVNSRFEVAAIAIFIAMVFDGLDGRVARLTNTESDFGAQYDSLSDVVSFGLAPSLIVYEWTLFKFGKVGWLVAFVFAAAAALRLARFNSVIEGNRGDLRYFSGLPTPVAAALVAALVWVGVGFDLDQSKLWSIFTAGSVGMLALLMVSEVKYLTFKDFDLQGKVPFVAILSIVLIYVLVSIEPASVLLVIFSIYTASGIVAALLRKIKSEFTKN